jgi:DNA-binding beta-propeller fold protein YncE
MKLDPADPTKQIPDNRMSIIDLKANPPTIIGTVETSKGPAGVAIGPKGNIALVANREEGTVSVFAIDGKKLTALGKVDFGNPRSGPSGITITPVGMTALVTRDGDSRISVVAIDRDKAERTAAEFGISQVLTDFDDLLRIDLDLVDICTPSSDMTRVVVEVNGLC